MRLWHQAMIKNLDNNRLVRQHCECCALRGNGWGKPHATVNYVFKHSPIQLVLYHYLVYKEMLRRGYNFDSRWLNPAYRGSNCELNNTLTLDMVNKAIDDMKSNGISLIYAEHNTEYYEECINNLKNKGVDILKYRKELM